MQYYPLFVQTDGAKALVMGGGETALAKLRLLLKTDFQITVVSNDPSPDLQALASDGHLEILQTLAQAGPLSHYRVLFAADEEPAQRQAHGEALKASGQLVNVVDQQSESDFLTPAIVDRAPVTVAIGTEGAAPVLGRLIKSDIERALPQDLGERAEAARAFRAAASALPEGRPRRAFWRAFFTKTDSALPAKARLIALLKQHQTAAPSEGGLFLLDTSNATPDLMSLKALRELEDADRIVIAGDVPKAFLELARREAPRLEITTDVTAWAEALSPLRSRTERVVILANIADAASLAYLASRIPCLQILPVATTSQDNDIWLGSPCFGAPSPLINSPKGLAA